MNRIIRQDLSPESYDFLNVQGWAHQESFKNTEKKWSEKFEEKPHDIIS